MSSKRSLARRRTWQFTQPRPGQARPGQARPGQASSAYSLIAMSNRINPVPLSITYRFGADHGAKLTVEQPRQSPPPDHGIAMRIAGTRREGRRACEFGQIIDQHLLQCRRPVWQGLIQPGRFDHRQHQNERPVQVGTVQPRHPEGQPRDQIGRPLGTPKPRFHNRNAADRSRNLLPDAATPARRRYWQLRQ